MKTFISSRQQRNLFIHPQTNQLKRHLFERQNMNVHYLGPSPSVKQELRGPSYFYADAGDTYTRTSPQPVLSGAHQCSRVLFSFCILELLLELSFYLHFFTPNFSVTCSLHCSSCIITPVQIFFVQMRIFFH